MKNEEKILQNLLKVLSSVKIDDSMNLEEGAEMLKLNLAIANFLIFMENKSKKKVKKS